MKHSGCAAAFLAIIALLAANPLANAQFKVIGPAPFPPAEARQKIAALLQNVDANDRQQTIQTLTGWLGWYRDLIDDELIAAWHKDARSNLPQLIDALADSHVATDIIQFSWREQRASAFALEYAPLFGRLMIRFPESSKPFLDDLLARPTPSLSEPEAETVCRILVDMPDVGAWRKTALGVLPHYRQAAQNLLNQDLRSGDHEKSFQAQIWMNDLQLDPSAVQASRSDPTRSRRRAVSPDYPVTERPPSSNQTAAAAPADSTPSLSRRPPAPAAQGSVVSAAPSYQGPLSGTLESVGSPIPQNAEYVFRNVPLAQLKLDYDTKTWEARLAPGDARSQRLIVRNRSSGPQKRCVVHWSVIQ